MYNGYKVFREVTGAKAELEEACKLLCARGGRVLVVSVQGKENDPMTSFVPGEVGEVALE